MRFYFEYSSIPFAFLNRNSNAKRSNKAYRVHMFTMRLADDMKLFTQAVRAADKTLFSAIKLRTKFLITF